MVLQTDFFIIGFIFIGPVCLCSAEKLEILFSKKPPADKPAAFLVLRAARHDSPGLFLPKQGA